MSRLDVVDSTCTKSKKLSTKWVVCRCRGNIFIGVASFHERTILHVPSCKSLSRQRKANVVEHPRFKNLSYSISNVRIQTEMCVCACVRVCLCLHLCAGDFRNRLYTFLFRDYKSFKIIFFLI